MSRVVFFPVYPGRGYGCGGWPILQKITRTKQITCKQFCFSDSQRLHKILQLEHWESWLIISMSRSTSWETELGKVWSCKWLGSSIIAKLWLNNDPTVEDGMLAWSECLGLCREVRFSAKDELPRRSSMDVFSLLKRWGVKELYFKPTDVSGVRDGGIEEGSDVKLGWITVFCAKIFQSAVGTFVRGDSGRSGEIFPFSTASENADDTLGKQQSLLALKTWWAAALAALDFAFSFSFWALFFFMDPKLFSLSLWLSGGFFFLSGFVSTTHFFRLRLLSCGVTSSSCVFQCAVSIFGIILSLPSAWPLLLVRRRTLYLTAATLLHYCTYQRVHVLCEGNFVVCDRNDISVMQ